MEENKTSNRIHPLVAGAAVSVMLVSLVGVAAITGLIPSSHSTSGVPTGFTPSTASAVATAATSPAALIDSKVNTNESPADTPRIAQKSNSQAQAAQGPGLCSSCGRVESVHTIQHQAKPSGLGMVGGAVLGGVLGNQIGGGNGRTLATVAGAVGGGYAGNEVEKNTRATTSYQVRVRMDDGRIRTFPYSAQPGWNAGDRVRVVDGHLTARS